MLDKELIEEMYLYSMYDSASKKYASPIMCDNDAVAIRMYKMSLRDVPAEFISDYKLYRLAIFNVVNGSIISDPQIVNITDNNLDRNSDKNIEKKEV